MLLMVGAAATGVMMSRGQNPGVSALRSQISDALAPAIEAMSVPLHAVQNAGEWIGGFFTLHSQTLALKEAQAQLAQWQATAKTLEAENKSLKSLIAVVPPGKARNIAARIVSDSANPYIHAALISAGSEDGVGKDEAVVSAQGLLGRVIEAGKSSAHVLLLTDINSRVPVIGEISRERSILAGNNTQTLTLAYVQPHSKLMPGERIVTSGDGGIFPAGIPVAVIISADESGVKAAPLADWQQADYVSVVNYTF